MKKVVTHNGDFHADDIFAVATLSLYFDGGIEIVRTRDEDLIRVADLVVDVGMQYEHDRGRYDHHQPGGGGERENGIPYAAFGLVWKHYGKSLCDEKEAVWQVIDEMVAQPIDALDNGIKVESTASATSLYTIQDIVASFRPTWEEPDNRDQTFLELVDLAKQILAREITQALAYDKAQEHVEEAYRAAKDKRIIVFSEKFPFQTILMEKPEPLLAVYPRSDGSWGVKTIRVERMSFENRLDLPAEWAGKTGQDLQELTEVETATFCHRARFLCVAQNKEDAVNLANIALETGQN